MLSHLGQVVGHEDRKFNVDSKASLHVSKHALAPDAKDTIKRSQEPTVDPTVKAKAQSTEEATVYVNALNYVVIMLLLEDSPAVLSFGLLCEDMGYC